MPQTTILVIEDSWENRSLLRRLLEREGYAVLEAAQGVDGLRLAREEMPDLIVLDMNLPDIDGFEVAQRLKGDARTARILVIAHTANTMKGDKERTFEAGCDGYIPKPLDIADFADKINAFLKGREWE